MPKVGNKHYPYTPEGRAAAARDRQVRGLTATEGFNQPGQLDDAAGRAMMKKGGKVTANKSSGRSKASKRADGISRQGHTKGRVV